MEHRDEHIDCADCGAQFLFSASEAAIFAQRGLASPKRCKDCRRARKERGGQGDGRQAQGNGRGYGAPMRASGPHDNGGFRGPPRGDFGRDPWGGSSHAPSNTAPSHGGPSRGGPRRAPGPARYTGDVNEYRSPMPDPSYGGFSAPQPQGRGFGGPRPYGDRGPRRGPPPVRDDGNYRAPSSHGQGDAFANGRGAPRAHQGQGNGQGAPRRRPEGETFQITCNSCGVQAEVPFRPAEGRDVFCQACYRARKPA